jgi:adenosine deaminase CECR1
MKSTTLPCCLLMIVACTTDRPPGEERSAADYRISRQQLFDAAYARRPGRDSPLSDDEQRVALRLAQLKHDVYAVGGDEWPARPFWEVRQRLEGTGLFAFLRAMPKGGLLHVHGAAVGDMDWLIKAISQRDDAYVYRGPADAVPRGALRLSRTPPGAGWVRLTEERSHDPQAFDAALYRDLTMGSDDAEVDDPWQRFNRSFAMLRGLYEPAIAEAYFRRALVHLIRDDHLLYVEIRTGPRPDLIQTIGRLRDELRQTWPHFDLRIIINVGRYEAPGESRDEAESRFRDLMRTTAKLVDDEASLVVGFDLVAEEDGGLPTAFFADTVAELRAQGLELPLYLHAGESNRPAALGPRDCEYRADCDAPLNNNLFDAVLLGSRRIGHGLALAKLPGLIEEVRRRGIAVEVCPISNQILGYVPDLRSHPALTLLNAGVPVTISSDDPALFQYQGVAHDWWMATIAWNLDLRDLRQLAINSLVHSALPDPDKEIVLDAWREQWRRFITEQAAAESIGESP